MAKLYPKIRPYKKGYLNVSDGYKLYYELCGNPKGKPVLFLHGGPGAGTSPKDRRFFNPRVYNVILFDQRGAGKSRPFASTKNNTTWKLVEDINLLLKHFGIKKVFLFGGSWGSTLALVYAIKYPKKVTGMLLRGIFFCEPEDENEFFGGSTAYFFPDAWERFVSLVSKKYRKNSASITKYYIKQMKSKSKKIRDKYALEWSLYEIKLLELDTSQKTIRDFIKKGIYKSLGPLEAHYYGGGNLCFLPKDFIRKNLHKLEKIPTFIVHGRYDVICRPSNAYLLHKMLPKSKLYFPISGHWSHDKNLEEKLVEEMDKFARIIK